MGAYFDTGIVVKWYVEEPNSPEAFDLRARFKPPLVLTSFHRVELLNAIQLKVFRGELTEDESAGATVDFESDIRMGLWEDRPSTIQSIQQNAERLVTRHTAGIGTRTLDILHVAAALALGCETFVSSDARQLALADAVGLAIATLPKSGKSN